MRVIVVGGGISGLTAAFLARAAGHDAVCVDDGATAGGLIQSARIDGFLCEGGPQAVLDDAPDTLALIAAAGLEPRILRAAAEARRRFIYARGRLHPLPMSPPALLRSGLLSPFGKARLLMEPLIRKPRALPADDAETVAAFGARRLGKEAARTLLGTAVIGIFAADAQLLSAASSFPRVVALEHTHGSLFRGTMARRKSGHRPGQPLSFPDGLGELPAALGRRLGAGLLRSRALAIEPRARGGWRLTTEGIDGSGRRHLEGDALVLATGADTAAALLAPIVPEAATALSDLPTAPVAVCCLGFRDAPDNLGMDLAAYGFLVARGQSPRLLGCQYESSTFAGRAPPGAVLLRAILGGRGEGFEPGIVERTDEEIGARALSDLREIAGLQRQPDLVRVWRHPKGIPLYTPGHAARVSTVDGALRAHPGLFVLGHALRGVGVNESIRAATALARQVLSPASALPAASAES